MTSKTISIGTNKSKALFAILKLTNSRYLIRYLITDLNIQHSLNIIKLAIILNKLLTTYSNQNQSIQNNKKKTTPRHKHNPHHKKT